MLTIQKMSDRFQRRKEKKSLTGHGVFNLSSKVLTQEELSVLDKGLKYAPPQKIDKFSTFIDVHKYIRKVNIQHYLISNPYRTNYQAATSGTVHSGLSHPSLFSPLVPIAPAVKIFRDLVLKRYCKTTCEAYALPTIVQC